MHHHHDDRQSEKSHKSFTQVSQHQKYDLKEPNFDFSSEELPMFANEPKLKTTSNIPRKY